MSTLAAGGGVLFMHPGGRTVFNMSTLAAWSGVEYVTRLRVGTVAVECVARLSWWRGSLFGPFKMGMFTFTSKKCVTSRAYVPQGIKGPFNLIVFTFILFNWMGLLFLGKTEPRAREPR